MTAALQRFWHRLQRSCRAFLAAWREAPASALPTPSLVLAAAVQAPAPEPVLQPPPLPLPEGDTRFVVRWWTGESFQSKSGADAARFFAARVGERAGRVEFWHDGVLRDARG